MSKQDDGGPAFPVPGLQHDESFNGMTLHDWFAGQVQFAPDEPTVHQAKAVMKEEPPTWPPFSDSNDYEQMETCIRWWATARAKLRLIEADAMLAARKETR